MELFQCQDFVYEKIRVATENLQNLIKVKSEPVSFDFLPIDEYKKDNTPPALSADWQTFIPDSRFTGIDKHFWVHIKLPALASLKDKEYRLHVKTGREGEWEHINPQCTMFVNGKTTQALDLNHTWLPLESGKDLDIYIYLYTGMVGGTFDFIVTLDTIDLLVESLYYDVNVPFEAMKLLDKKSYNYIQIRNALDKALVLLDLRHSYSDDFYKSIDATAKYLKEEFYEKICGTRTEGLISCIGHTHIDVAWLWTVAQTKEKAQRSFSTVLNMMKKYDDYLFMSSQPQLYQHVKEADPELYEEIKKRIKEGKWETEGSMWLEADTNLSSGESLIRQIMYGKRFMREEFGIENKMLWLPDVFGYSGALPQILKKSGVSQFFTAKMSWNETNDMPHDTFIWEGIDGSQVFASIVPSYVNNLDPARIKMFWDEYKDKTHNDNTIVTFGYGDGGGGPTYEMMENYERLKYGIPGMPQVKIERAGEFFDRIEKTFRKNVEELQNEPKWVGEMYLELHRGTYTSIGKNKKNNRKSELLYQEAETLATSDMLLSGADYPVDTLRKNQTNILLNQFHDIIPGSSIKEVYDVTDTEYARILADGRKIADDSLSDIKANLNTTGGIFVYNPTPFEYSGFAEFEGKTYKADNIPAHGWRVIEDKPQDSGISVSEKVIENDIIRVTFDDDYHIISIFDKAENREVLSRGAKANRLEVFEDYPRTYDAWEITSYYKQKMWGADDVANVELLENGIRVTRKYQKSEIKQDIVLSKGSKRVDFITTVDWHEDHVLLKAAFPVDIRCPYATYDIQFGNLQRPTHKNTSWDAAKFEVCAHKWADLSESGYGVSIINDCKYGHSIEENVMKISLLKAATYPNPEADRGINTFTYSLFPHTGGYEEGKTVIEGYRLNMPLELSKVSANSGKLSDDWSIVSSNCENVVIETIKKAEEDNSIIVRMYETYNKKANATITAGFDFKEVYLCDLMENNIEKLDNTGRDVAVKVKNYEIVTLKFVF